MDNDRDNEKEDKGEEEQSLKIDTPTPETIEKFKDVLVSQEDTRAFLARFL
jgi:hypothetical protein